MDVEPMVNFPKHIISLARPTVPAGIPFNDVS